MPRYRIGTPYVVWHYLEVEADDAEAAVEKHEDERSKPYEDATGGVSCLDGSLHLVDEPIDDGAVELYLDVQEAKT